MSLSLVDSVRSCVKRMAAVVVMLGAVFASCGARADGVIYVNGAATGAGDGSSWTDAYTDVATAVKAANESQSSVYIAKGVYTLTSALSVTNIPAIYGGFKGDDPDETVEARQYDVNKTVLSGDQSGDDYWCHVVPNLGSDFGYELTELSEEPLIKNGALNLPPAFTGDYDLYLPVIKTTNTGTALSIMNGVTGIVDGLHFVGFSANGVVKYLKDTKQTDLVNCRFVGNQPRYGAVKNEDTSVNKYLTCCKFLYNRGYEVQNNQTVSCIDFSKGGLQLRQGEFVSCGFLAARSDTKAHMMMNIQSGLDWNVSLHKTISDCTFTRCYSRMRNGYASYGLINGYMTTALRFRDCVFSNNLAVAAKAGYTVTLFPDASSECIGCSFIGNRLEQNLGALGEIYLFGSYEYHKIRHNYDACSFVGNSVFAKGSTLTSGSVIATILGSVGSGNAETDNQRSQFTNCIFDDNKVDLTVPAGVTAYRCRGVYNRCRTANAYGSSSLGNCVFVGPKTAGVCDLLQYSNHSLVFNIVNCHFQYTGGEPYDDGFVFLKPALVKLYSCTLANYVTPDVAYAIDNHAYDPLPFVTNYVGNTRRPVLVPSAKTPAIRSSADIVYNGSSFVNNMNSYTTRAGFMTNYAFRASSMANWQILTTNMKALDSDVSKNPQKHLMCDAVGTVRPLLTATRGAVQNLTDTAENGATLTLRKDPFDAGSLVGPQVQAVASGAAIAPVTAVPNAGCTFVGWYDTEGKLYSDTATLTIEELDASRVLTARFGTPKTKIVYVLGPHATFDETGEHAYTNEQSRGVEFPAAPDFTVDDGWVFGKWSGEFPLVVPGEDLAYTAKIVTASLRTIRVDAASTASEPDGLSWAGAYRSLSDAYADAAIGQGEVWIKEGVYRLTDSIVLKSNVTLRGGFAGTETSFAEADPAAHPTVLTGDTTFDNVWVPQSKANATNPSITFDSMWKDGSFVRPDPDMTTDLYWACCDGYRKGAMNDTLIGFTATSPVENVGFYGITFACFGKYAIADSLGGTTPLVVSNCQFFANNGPENSGGFAVSLTGRALRLTDSLFSGNVGCVSSSASAVTSLVANCTFDANHDCSDSGDASGLSLSGAQQCVVTNCVFTRTYRYQDYYFSASGSLYLAPAQGGVFRFADCSVLTNRMCELMVGDIVVAGAGRVEFERCRFLDLSKPSAGSCAWSNMKLGANLTQHSGTLAVRDSVFTRCRTVYTGNVAYPTGAILTSHGGTATFLNSTFEDCSATATDASPAGIFACCGTGGKVGIVSCLFLGMKHSGTPSGFFAADADTKTTSFNVLNTAIVNSSNDFRVAYLKNNAACLGFANCVVDNFDATALPSGSNGYFYDVTTNTPVVVDALRQGANGAWARVVRSEKSGRRVWLKDGVAYFRDEVANPDKPWRKATDKAFFAAAVDGLPDIDALLPNAYGEKRSSGRSFFGPATVKTGLLLIVR